MDAAREGYLVISYWGFGRLVLLFCILDVELHVLSGEKGNGVYLLVLLFFLWWSVVLEYSLFCFTMLALLGVVFEIVWVCWFNTGCFLKHVGMFFTCSDKSLRRIEELDFLRGKYLLKSPSTC